MSWVTVIWSVGVGACLTLAFIQFLVWWKYRAARANLAFSVLAIAVAEFTRIVVNSCTYMYSLTVVGNEAKLPASRAAHARYRRAAGNGRVSRINAKGITSWKR